MLSKLYIKFPKAWYFIVISFDLILACARYLFFSFSFHTLLTSLADSGEVVPLRTSHGITGLLSPLEHSFSPA